MSKLKEEWVTHVSSRPVFQNVREYDRLLFSISCQMVHNRITAQSISLVIVCLHNYQLQPHILLCQCWFPVVTLSMHVILSPDPETQCNSFWPFLYFFMNTLKHHMFSVLCEKVNENYRCHSVQTLHFCSTIALDMLEVTVQVRRSVTEQKAGGSILGYKPQVVRPVFPSECECWLDCTWV